MSAISLVDAERQWFKAQRGPGGVGDAAGHVLLRQTPCRATALFVVPGHARLDPRFSDNRLVTGEPYLRFYAGAPIRAVQRRPARRACACSMSSPRPGGADRRAGERPPRAGRPGGAPAAAPPGHPRPGGRRPAGADGRLGQPSARSPPAQRPGVRRGRLVGLGRIETDRVVASLETAREYGLDPVAAAAGVPLGVFLANVHPHDQRWLADAIAEARRSGKPFREEYRLLRPDGQVCWTSARGRCLHDVQGAARALPGHLGGHDRTQAHRRPA